MRSMTLSVLISTVLLCAVAPTAQARVLRTTAELNAFPDDSTRRYTPFCITGTVQAVERGTAQGFILGDASGLAQITNLSDSRPAPGDRVVVSGRAHMSSHQESDFAALKIDPLGRGEITPPLELALGDISEEAHHLRKIVTEGTVVDSFQDEIDSRNHFLLVKNHEDILPVALHASPDVKPDLETLRDARVRVKGHFMRTASGLRKFSGPLIAVDDRSDLTVVIPAPDDPFAAPPLEKTLYRTPREIARLGKRSVSGEVLAVWDGNRMMVRTAYGRVVNLTLAHGETVLPPGSSIIAAGYPETDLFRINLSRAIVRETSAVAAPQDEPAITDISAVFHCPESPNAIDPLCHGRLLRVRGTVQSVPSPEVSERRLLLACGPYKLPVDLGLSTDAAADIPVGTILEVSARCLLETESWNPEEVFPRIRNVIAVIRGPEDLRVISRPSWWTPIRLLVVISVLLAALIGVYIWNRTLQRLVSRRGRELYREQVAHAVAEFKTGERTRLAVELHDSLSQSLAGVACHVAASARALDKSPADALRCIRTANKMLNSCRTELRQCLFDLRSDTLDETDFSTAVRKTLDQLDGNAAISVRFNVPRPRLKDTTAHAILAIVRELTGNAIRHGGATEVKIAGCMEPDRILFSVRDNGCGFSPENCNGPLQGHFGLEGIRNRLVKLNGTFTIDSRPGDGTRATVTIPLPQSK